MNNLRSIAKFAILAFLFGFITTGLSHFGFLPKMEATEIGTLTAVMIVVVFLMKSGRSKL